MRAMWAAIAGISLAVAVGAVSYAAGTAKAPSVIRAQRFELVDAAGKVRALLAVTPGGGPTLKLVGNDLDQNRSATLSAQDGLSLFDESGEQSSVLSHRELRVLTKGARTGAVVSAKGIPEIGVCDPEKPLLPSIRLWTSTRGNPVMMLGNMRTPTMIMLSLDKEGRPAWVLPQDIEGY